ncbi:MAG: peptidoglycan synthetase [Flavobacteriales bacterium]|nr:peptidoglycan synthetase [Flavobacteriales bacterium]|tara:strand:+ start:3713 stop:5047 length:1335 start_codon:yes stop_codon:yes gene_type:complete
MKIHLIAIGGSAMHNMALALYEKGFDVTGSDDAIFNPSKSRLEKAGLLPKKMGWFPKKITEDIDAIILGMHARGDNPELKKAQEIGLSIYSYPEYIYEQSKDKMRVVIGGSHGKTSITAMILHVLQYHQIDCDYMVGAQLEGFTTMVKLTHEAPFIILEGDEYLSSPIDRKPKFHWYKPHLAVLSGIAWDHINVFPTFQNYVDQFRIFRDDVSDCLIYCEEDEHLRKLAKEGASCRLQPYTTLAHRIANGITYLQGTNEEVPLAIFGEHNLQNLNAARLVCKELRVSESMFLEAIQSFKGASKRLELVKSEATSAVYKDFAHSPSKLKATSTAMKKQFSDRKLVACMELHTFSSLNEDFLQQYAHCMDEPDTAIVYFSPSAIAHKKLEPITKEQVHAAFAREDLMVFTDSQKIQDYLQSLDWNYQNLLMMSSGSFDGIDFETLL